MGKEPSENVRRKHYIKSRGKQWARELLQDCVITENEARAFEMFYFQEKDIASDRLKTFFYHNLIN